ncbi:MAG: response regulator transcription factor [Williamsia sp.]|nr:response regulator transcription factor [Williamsia sp.]
MLKCIAVDDEPLALKLLEDNISKVPFLEPVAYCRNVFDAMKVLQETTIDLIFIDIQMPGLTGLQFIGSLENKPLVIFVTAYKQYALDSYDLAVVDYLVKPVSLERFVKACNRAKELHELKQLKQQPTPPPSADYFFLNADYSQVKIAFNDIIWIEGLRDYVKIYLKSTPKPLLFRISLKAVELELPPAKFIRIHKSFIVAIESITSIRKNSVFIKDMELPIGETFREAVDRLIKRREL